MSRSTSIVSATALTVALLWNLPAQAQDASPAPAGTVAPPDAEITVTGTRIQRDGYQAPTPLTVLGAEDIEASAPANIADYVNDIPSLVGSVTPASSNLNISAGTAGVNALNLRALGTARTLVLLDGQRSVGSTLGGLVDVNTFPQGLIKSVEIVTGGASAAYGSDAVSGVVNFILDKEYTGLKASAEYGLTAYGDAPSYRATLTAGKAFAAGRGHILLNGEIAVKQGLHRVPRDWNQQGWYMINNPAYVAGNGEPERLVVRGAGLSLATPGGIITDTELRGTTFGLGGAVGQFDYGTVRNPWMIGGDWQSTQVNSYQSLDPSENRKSLFGRLSYEVADWLNLFVQASYAKSKNIGHLGIQLNQGNVTIRSDNAFIPEEVRTRLDDLGIAEFKLGTTNANLPVRKNDTRRELQRYVVGANGSFDLFGSEARWDAYYQKGISRTREMARDISNNARLALAQDAVFAPAGNALGVPEGTIVCRSSLTDTDNGCIPFNRLGIGTASQEARDWVLGNPFRNQKFQQDVFAANLSFDPFDLPAGPVSVAIGGEHRREKVSGEVLPEYQSGWFVGNFLPSFGSYHVTEAYLELLVPVIEGLDLNGAVRGTDYSTSGYVTTWKAGLTFEPIPDIRIRATRSRDIRAPNLGELFTAGSTRINVLIDPTQNNASVQFAGTTRGNPALKPETADQWGVGVVLQPQFLRGFALSVDYYDIKIKGAIGSVDAQTIVDRCAEGVQEFCSAVVRGPNDFGNNLQVFESPFNFAVQRAKGIDFESSYRVPVASGNLTLRAMATRYIKNYFDNGIEVPTDTVGQNAPGGTPKWLYRVQGTYSNDDFTFNLTGRGVSSGVYDTSFIECTASCPVSTVTNRTINDNRIAGAFYLDASLTFNIEAGGREMQFYLAANNLLDKNPPVVAPGPAGSAYATPATNQSLYDLLGRTFRVGVRFEM
ncbi:TonB-dependent receptor plug domain-containing protein [Sphingopyxis panaciterrulae]|uniref:Outer membrane receptor protein involved in Fe transport n=1 Tax=Sphingopyxis panaciterrulae TaxID=462372 RepID=A0A7W9ERS8_9SPHN|nr:TonB-dependent receptor [Sphingopyxis panaciterrulae]MBB5708057.1 outer membrane receptor protein involved in Fe transport [Sphingopyxis panaciterrulae]